MEVLLNRYRNLTLLVAVILAQLALLGYQRRSNQELRPIRVWAVTAVTPLARVIEAARSNTSRFLSDYFVLLDVRDENRRMRAELDRVNMENQYLKTELATADRARALEIFQKTSPSKTIAAHVIGDTTDSSANVVIVDRGTTSKIEAGMAVIVADGIVGKVISVYPTASFVMLITDPTFAAGVVSQKNHVRGTLEGEGHSTVRIKYVQNEQNVAEGEWFYTSGDDRIFPKGRPVGQASVVRPGKSTKDIFVTPSAFQNGFPEEVLIVVEGVHAEIPESPAPSSQPIHLLPPPTGEANPSVSPSGASTQPPTDADRLYEQYKQIGEAQNHVYGAPKSAVPNYNMPLVPQPLAGKTGDASKPTAPPHPNP